MPVPGGRELRAEDAAEPGEAHAGLAGEIEVVDGLEEGEVGALHPALDARLGAVGNLLGHEQGQEVPVAVRMPQRQAATDVSHFPVPYYSGTRIGRARTHLPPGPVRRLSTVPRRIRTGPSSRRTRRVGAARATGAREQLDLSFTEFREKKTRVTSEAIDSDRVSFLSYCAHVNDWLAFLAGRLTAEFLLGPHRAPSDRPSCPSGLRLTEHEATSTGWLAPL